jgi:hypothetical protein
MSFRSPCWPRIRNECRDECGPLAHACGYLPFFIARAAMATLHYEPPVDQLLTLGIPEGYQASAWINYPGQFGLTLDHLPDLLRLAASWQEDVPDETPDSVVYAPVHAWRAIGQLRSEAAIAPLFDQLTKFANNPLDEWILEELPEVLGLIGPAVIPPLTAYLADPSPPAWAKVTAARTFVPLVQQHPEQRSSAIEALTTALAAFAQNDPEMNGFLISYLLDLAAVEAAPTIEQAFAAQAVDPTIAGDWDDVQVSLGLKSPDELPLRAPFYPEGRSLQHWAEPLVQTLGGSPQKSKARAKNKIAKQSRQKNRKKRK